MSRMTSDAQMRCQSLESSILFMQQEHASTLKGLHEEIHKLQQRCSELTFKLAMDATSLPEEESEDYKTKSEKLDAEVKEKAGVLEQLEETLSKKKKKTLLLEQQIKAQGKKYTDELKYKNQCISGLQAELESKSSTIAYLTSQLHKLRTRSKEKGSSATQAELNPSPPKEAAPKSGVRRHSRHLPADPERQVLSASVKVRAASGRKLPEKPDTPETVPDPTPFLPHEGEVRHSSQIVLPPIGKSFEENAAVSLAQPQKRDSNMFLKRKQLTKDSGGSPEVEVMAIQEVHKQDASVRRPKECHSPDWK